MPIPSTSSTSSSPTPSTASLSRSVLEVPCNLVVVHGVLSRDPRTTALASGTTLVLLDVTVRPPGGATSTVPVAWFDPPASAARLTAGRAVVVVGRVERRFFRSAAGTASRTEVVADRVVPATARARVRAALAPVAAQLDLSSG